MSQKQFDPKVWKKKITIYVSIEKSQGIYAIWDWNVRLKKYCKRMRGNKFYVAKRVSGKQLTMCFVNFVDAQKWKQDLSFDYEHSCEGVTFREVKERYLSRQDDKVEVSTREYNRSKVRHLKYFDRMPMEMITSKVVDDWIDYIKRPEYLALQHKTRATYKNELSLLRQIFKYHAEYNLDKNVAEVSPLRPRHNYDCVVHPKRLADNEKMSRERFLTECESLDFLSYLESKSEDGHIGEVIHMLAFLQLRTGLRVGEACALHWEDVDFQERTAFIHRGVIWSRLKGRETFISPRTKNGVDRLIFLPQDLVASLKEWKLKTGRFKGLVISFDGKEPLSRRQIEYRFNRAYEAVGVKWRGTHVLRHTFATMFMEKTGDKEALQGLLGHKHPLQTSHYAKITPEMKRRGVSMFEKALKKESKDGKNQVDES